MQIPGERFQGRIVDPEPDSRVEIGVEKKAAHDGCRSMRAGRRQLDAAAERITFSAMKRSTVSWKDSLGISKSRLMS